MVQGPITTRAVRAEPHLSYAATRGQQSGSQRVHHGDGLGLGLAVVAAITRTHRAKINATPRPQCALEVSVTFEMYQRWT